MYFLIDSPLSALTLELPNFWVKLCQISAWISSPIPNFSFYSNSFFPLPYNEDFFHTAQYLSISISFRSKHNKLSFRIFRTGKGDVKHMLSLRHMNPANSICLNCCSCYVTGQDMYSPYSHLLLDTPLGTVSEAKVVLPSLAPSAA